ncbi:MAG TPA: YceI family protein [Terriglobia bacterium]|nr:YceI family protein [Terriglobia bacterium]
MAPVSNRGCGSEASMGSLKAAEEAISPAATEIEKLIIDPGHSSIVFSVRHMVINDIRGRFTRFSGIILYSRRDAVRSSVSLTIDATTVNTDNSDRDNDLRSAKFFDSARFPQVVFHSKRIDQLCDGYVCVGDLTLHGVTEETAICFEITGRQKDLEGKERIGFKGDLKLDRRKFGLTYNAFLANGGPVVGNEIKINLSIEAVRE